MSDRIDQLIDSASKGSSDAQRAKGIQLSELMQQQQHDWLYSEPSRHRESA